MQEAKLQVIQYSNLQHSDAERLKLFEACSNDGIFYMDLSGATSSIDNVVAGIYELQRRIFDLPISEKLRYDIDVLSPRKFNGYKPIGRNHGELNGGKDGFESYALPKDEIMGLSTKPFLRPSPVNEFMPSLQTFCSTISMAIHLLLDVLSNQLQVKDSERFENMHRSHGPTPDVIRLLKYCKQPASEIASSHVPHTDLGSLTFLFTEQPGLQIQRNRSEAWETVTPLPGHAIVNLGDSLSKLSGGVLKSCLHRVASLTPNSPRDVRYSFGYFCRAEDSVLMRPVVSPFIALSSSPVAEDQEILTSMEWMQNKFKALRADTWGKHNAWMLSAKT